MNLTRLMNAKGNNHLYAGFKDGSGNISSGELLLVMRALGKNPTEDEVLNLLMKADVDGNGTIDFEEFVKMMKTEVATENSALDFT